MSHLLYQVLAAVGVWALLNSTHDWLARHVPRYGAWVGKLPEW